MNEPDRPRVDQRRTGRSQDRRDEILRIAFELFAERGYRGTSLAAVADRAGLTQQGLLHHFPSKKVLLAGVLQRYEEVDVGRLFTGPAAATASLDRLAELIEYNASRPEVVRSLAVLVAESMTDDHPARAFFVARYAEFRKGAARMLDAEVRSGAPVGATAPDAGPDGPPLRHLTADQAATLIIAVMDGLQIQWLLQPDEVDMPALFNAFLDVLRR